MNLTSEGSIYMKEKVKNAIGVLLIYGLIIISIITINTRFKYLNQIENKEKSSELISYKK